MKARPRDWEDSLVENDYQEILEYIQQYNVDLENYDVIKSVYSDSNPEKNRWIKSYVDAGVNYIVDCLDPWRGKVESLFEIVERGPPIFY